MLRRSIVILFVLALGAGLAACHGESGGPTKNDWGINIEGSGGPPAAAPNTGEENVPGEKLAEKYMVLKGSVITQYQNDAAAGTATVTYKYNDDGTIAELSGVLEDMSGNSVGTENVSFAYDQANGKLKTVTATTESKVASYITKDTYSFDANGRLSQRLAELGDPNDLQKGFTPFAKFDYNYPANTQERRGEISAFNPKTTQWVNAGDNTMTLDAGLPISEGVSNKVYCPPPGVCSRGNVFSYRYDSGRYLGYEGQIVEQNNMAIKADDYDLTIEYDPSTSKPVKAVWTTYVGPRKSGRMADRVTAAGDWKDGLLRHELVTRWDSASKSDKYSQETTYEYEARDKPAIWPAPDWVPGGRSLLLMDDPEMYFGKKAGLLY